MQELTPAENFKQLKAKFEAEKTKYYLAMPGHLSYEGFRALAKEVADAYAPIAEEIAKKHGRKPKYLSVSTLVRA